MIKYGVIKEEYLEINKTSYGIFAYNEKGEVVKEVHSCSPTHDKIKQLAVDCTQGKLEACHLQDVVDDFIYQMK